jgi:hypothetical protein
LQNRILEVDILKVSIMGRFERDHSSVLHWPTDGHAKLLKGAEEDQVEQEVIKAANAFYKYLHTSTYKYKPVHTRIY